MPSVLSACASAIGDRRQAGQGDRRVGDGDRPRWSPRSMWAPASAATTRARTGVGSDPSSAAAVDSRMASPSSIAPETHDARASRSLAAAQRSRSRVAIDQAHAPPARSRPPGPADRSGWRPGWPRSGARRHRSRPGGRRPGPPPTGRSPARRRSSTRRRRRPPRRRGPRRPRRAAPASARAPPTHGGPAPTGGSHPRRPRGPAGIRARGIGRVEPSPLGREEVVVHRLGEQGMAEAVCLGPHRGVRHDDLARECLAQRRPRARSRARRQPRPGGPCARAGRRRRRSRGPAAPRRDRLVTRVSRTSRRVCGRRVAVLLARPRRAAPRRRTGCRPCVARRCPPARPAARGRGSPRPGRPARLAPKRGSSIRATRGTRSISDSHGRSG